MCVKTWIYTYVHSSLQRDKETETKRERDRETETETKRGWIRTGREVERIWVELGKRKLGNHDQNTLCVKQYFSVQKTSKDFWTQLLAFIPAYTCTHAHTTHTKQSTFNMEFSIYLQDGYKIEISQANFPTAIFYSYYSIWLCSGAPPFLLVFTMLVPLHRTPWDQICVLSQVADASPTQFMLSRWWVLGDGTLREWLGHEDRALLNGISVLVKETPAHGMQIPAIPAQERLKVKEGKGRASLCYRRKTGRTCPKKLRKAGAAVHRP